MLNEREFLEQSHLDRGTLEIWIRQEWILPSGRDAERTYSDMDLARARLIHDLEHNMGVNEAGLDVILHLIDQMHGLRRALAEALASMHERGTGAG